MARFTCGTMRGKLFFLAEGIQAHKNDKSHYKLFTYGDATLESPEGCDFRSSSTDHREADEAEELPSDRILECDDETMVLIPPSCARAAHHS